MADENKKRYIGAGLQDEIYYALIKMATYTGRHPTSLIEEYVQRGLTEDTEYESSQENNHLPVELLVFKSLQAVKSQMNIRIMLRQIASNLIATTDEALADQLKKLCEDASVSFEELMSEAELSSLNVKGSISFEDDKGIAHAKSWLIQCFKNTVEIPSNSIYEAGESAGFSKAVLRSAKNDLGIRSIRQSQNWVWIMPASLRIPSLTEVKHGNK